MTSVPSPILISIEGNIGAGKSTLINRLREEYPTWNFIDEPVGTWTSLKTETGENLLELFYKDQSRWSYTFQNCALLSRAMNITQKINDWKAAAAKSAEVARNNIFITERCLETDYYVFAKMLHDSGKMNKMEWDLYKMWYNYVKALSYPLSGIIYVSPGPNVCKARITERGRKGEESIPLEYLTDLDIYQRKWLFEADSMTPVTQYYNSGMGRTSTLDEVEEFVLFLRDEK